MKHIIEDIGKTKRNKKKEKKKRKYKELKVAVMDRDQWRSIEVIEPT